MLENHELSDITTFAAHIVAAYVSNNIMKTEDVPNFIQLVHHSLCNINSKQSFVLGAPSNLAVSIENSISPDFIICLEDGRRLKMLKRHLKTAYNMTPEQYRERWGLPNNYPMVAPNYAKVRTAIAKDTGLGKHGKNQKKIAA
ncbi:MAG: MucR family transcriptional regulator [Alphaproteobacteria bacterium]|nr:MucR family transcriptional regulator [Alphaproteobacteria bacterium]